MIRKQHLLYNLILLCIVTLLFIVGSASATWWDSDFSSMSIITLNETVPLNNFQVHLSSDDFSIPEKMWVNMEQNGNDTRILSTDNTTVFPIWIETFNSPTDFSIYVNVTDDSTGDELLWYYGNDTYESVSSGTDTFIFFDDFNDGNYDGWTSVSGSWSATNGYLTESTSTEHVYITNPHTISTSEVFEYSSYGTPVFHYSDTNNHYYLAVAGKWYKKVGGGYNLLHTFSNSISSDKNTFNISISGATTTLEIEGESSSDTTYNNGLIGFDGYYTCTVDDVRIRLYNPTEPHIVDIFLHTFVNSPPSIPIAIYPEDQQYVTQKGIVELNVSSIDVDGDALDYYYYGSTIESELIFIGTNDSVGGSTFNWSVSVFDTYYWRVITDDGFEQSDFSDTFEFVYIPPSNLTSPSNTSTIYKTYPPLTSSIHFYWEDVESPQYRLVVAEDEYFNIMSIDTHIGVNNSNQELLVNKEYFWKVYSYDGDTYSDSSGVYSFNLTGNTSITGSAIEGVVYQSNGDITAISGAEVTIWNTTWSSSMITGSNGYYIFEDLNSGTVYNLQAKADRFWDSSIALVSAESDPITNNFYLIDDLTDTEWWHYVEFTVQNVWGVTYPDVATNVYIGYSPTVSDSGNTESDGTITFHMDQNVQYRITFINSTLGINEDITLYPVSNSYTVYIDSYTFDLPDVVTDDINAYIASSRINATHGYINFTWSDTSDLTTSINYYIHDVDGNELYNTSTSNSDLFDSQVVTATDDRYVVRYVGIHPTHGVVDQTETIVFHGGRRVDFGWAHDWQYAVTALAFLIFIGSLFGAKTAHYGAITVVMFSFIFKWIGWLNETNTSTLLIILAAVIAFGWSLRKSEEVKM